MLRTRFVKNQAPPRDKSNKRNGRLSPTLQDFSLNMRYFDYKWHYNSSTATSFKTNAIS